MEGPTKEELIELIQMSDHSYRFLATMIVALRQAKKDGASVVLPTSPDAPLIYVEYDQDKITFLNSWIGTEKGEPPSFTG